MCRNIGVPDRAPRTPVRVVYARPPHRARRLVSSCRVVPRAEIGPAAVLSGPPRSIEDRAENVYFQVAGDRGSYHAGTTRRSDRRSPGPGRSLPLPMHIQHRPPILTFETRPLGPPHAFA